MNLTLVIAFVAFDLVVTAALVLFLVKRRAGALGPAGIKGLREVMAVMQPEIDTAFQAGWSGDPSTLPGLLEPLLERLESEMQSRQLPADRATLKRTLGGLVASRRLAKSRDIDEALARVA